MGYSAPCLSQIVSDQILTSSLSPWFASVLIASQVVGSLSGPPLSDVVGRRRLLILLCPLSSLGWLLVATAHSSYQIFLARF